MADYAITNVARRIVYTGSAGVGPYAFSFPILVNTDIAVYKNTTLLTLTTDYTVTISGTTGQGSVTLVVAATGADRITIVGARSIERSTDFVTGGDFFANTLNTELDSETIFIQQIAETAERSIKAPVTDPTSIDMTLPANTTRANKFLSFNSTGNPQAVDSLGAYKGNWSASVDYVLQDIVKDTSNSNIYICISAHTSTGSQPISSNADVAKWSLVVDAAAAGTSATAAAASASAASTSATNAAASASTATTQASNASTSASTASTQASNASTSASNAASSASAASGSATTASTQASNASTSATNAASSASSASTSATNAANSATTATTQASNAATSASNASTSATSASGFATSASTQAGNAATSASNASTSATNAATSATNAATSATNAAASYDAFDDRYLGSKASAPSVDNDGNALLTGALYYNTTASQLYVWNGSAWDAAAFSVSGAVTSFSAGSTGFTPNTATTGAVTLGGTLAVANGGTGTSTAFTTGSVVFAGASGTYTQDNANFFWDDTNNRLGIGTTSPDALLTVNTIASFGDGAVGTPSIAHKGDLNTGLWFPAADTIAASTAGSERMRIDSSGNVGIGTTPSGSFKTEITGGTNQLKLEGSAQAAITLKKTGVNGATIYTDAANTTVFYRDAVGESMRIDSSGNVGIGTTSPGNPLTIYKSTNGEANALLYNDNAGTATEAVFYVGNANSSNASSFIGATGTAFTTASGFVQDAGYIGSGTLLSGGLSIMTRANADMRFYTNGHTNERMRIDSSGNVGINTIPIASTSTGKLQVSGGLQFNATNDGVFGNLYFSSGWKYVGNGTGGYIKFAQSSTNCVEIGYVSNNTSGANATASPSSLINIDPSGNVGIGTASPVAKLDIVGIATKLSPSVQTANVYSFFVNNGGTTYIGRDNSAGTGFGGDAYASVLYSSGAYPLEFFTNGTERMRIHSSGGVSIGNTTDSGAASLNVSGSMSGGYIAHANGTTAMAFGTDNVARVTPTATASYTTTVPAAGAICVLSILTSGATSYTITFSTGFKSTGTLATGTTTARYFNITFVSDGTNLIEMSRTVAIA
jgi:hypothetical protein